MTSGGRRRVLLEKRALKFDWPLLSHLILAFEARLGPGCRRPRARARAEGREGAREPTEPRVHGRWIVQLMRVSLETYAVLY